MLNQVATRRQAPPPPRPFLRMSTDSTPVHWRASAHAGIASPSRRRRTGGGRNHCSFTMAWAAPPTRRAARSRLAHRPRGRSNLDWAKEPSTRNAPPGRPRTGYRDGSRRKQLELPLGRGGGVGRGGGGGGSSWRNGRPRRIAGRARPHQARLGRCTWTLRVGRGEGVLPSNALGTGVSFRAAVFAGGPRTNERVLRAIHFSPSWSSRTTFTSSPKADGRV
jgi:hypothetical protein